MRAVRTHYNKIASHINDTDNQTEQEVYCKRLHKVTVPQKKDCDTCPYFVGVMGGYGHECTWEDCVPSIVKTIVIKWEDRNNEFMRVSKLIDEGLIKKG